VKRTVALAALAVGGLALAQPASPPPTVAFVGEQLELRELPGPCTATEVAIEPVDDAHGGHLCPPSYRFAARYRVVRALAGTLPAELAFRIDDGLGFPRFAEYRYALVVVTGEGERARLQPYQGYEVFPTADGDFATCGAPFAPGPAAEPIAFADTVVIDDVSARSAAFVATHYADPRYLVDAGRVRCRLGVRAGTLLAAIRDGVLKARGVTLAPTP
jgi:hypothetical protein